LDAAFRDREPVVVPEEFPNPGERRAEAVLQSKHHEEEVHAETEAGDCILRYGTHFLATPAAPLPLDAVEGGDDLGDGDVLHEAVVDRIALGKLTITVRAVREADVHFPVDVPWWFAVMPSVSLLRAPLPASMVPRGFHIRLEDHARKLVLVGRNGRDLLGEGLVLPPKSLDLLPEFAVLRLHGLQLLFQSFRLRGLSLPRVGHGGNTLPERLCFWP